MREVFKGWKRKVGCALLLLAFVFTIICLGNWAYIIPLGIDPVEEGLVEFYWQLTLPMTLVAGGLILWPQPRNRDGSSDECGAAMPKRVGQAPAVCRTLVATHIDGEHRAVHQRLEWRKRTA